MHQKSILCHALFFQQAVIQNIDAPKNPITNSTFLKAANAMTIQKLVCLVIRKVDICVSCLVSTLDASLSQVSVKKTCRLCWNAHRTVMLHWHRLSSTVPLAAPCCITTVLRQSLFSERAMHMQKAHVRWHRCKLHRHLLLPLPATVLIIRVQHAQSDRAQWSITNK